MAVRCERPSAPADASPRQDAYVRAVDEHYARIYRFLASLSGDRDLAEDLTRETFAAAWRHLAQFDGRSSFYAWLHKIALNAYRQHRRRAGMPVESLDAVDLEALPDPAPGLLARLTAEDLRESVRVAFACLPAIYREVLVLRVVQEMKYREIAHVLGLPLGTVQYRLHVAYRKLRAILEEEEEV